MKYQGFIYESPALEVVEIEAEGYCFSVSGGNGDGVGEGDDWPDFE